MDNGQEKDAVQNPDARESAKDVPIGFGLGLAMNEQAMEHYSQMAEEERRAWRERAGQVKSRAEMERLIDRLGEEYKM